MRHRRGQEGKEALRVPVVVSFSVFDGGGG